MLCMRTHIIKHSDKQPVNVRQLIAELQKHDADTPICAETHNRWIQIESVELMKPQDSEPTTVIVLDF